MKDYFRKKKGGGTINNVKIQDKMHFVWRRIWQPHSSSLAWEIPWKEEPGGLQSKGLQKSQT